MNAYCGTHVKDRTVEELLDRAQALRVRESRKPLTPGLAKELERVLTELKSRTL